MYRYTYVSVNERFIECCFLPSVRKNFKVFSSGVVHTQTIAFKFNDAHALSALRFIYFFKPLVIHCVTANDDTVKNNIFFSIENRFYMHRVLRAETK